LDQPSSTHQGAHISTTPKGCTKGFRKGSKRALNFLNIFFLPLPKQSNIYWLPLFVIFIEYKESKSALATLFLTTID